MSVFDPWEFEGVDGDCWYNVYTDQVKTYAGESNPRIKTKIIIGSIIPHTKEGRVVGYDIKVKRGSKEQIELFEELGLKEPRVDNRKYARRSKDET